MKKLEELGNRGGGMSADEIRRLAKFCDVFADMACDNAKDPEGAIDLYEKMQEAFLDYAAMVERCERLRLNMIPHRRDVEIVDYILRGDARREAEMAVETTEKQGKKLKRYADWYRIEREVKRYINEGNELFTVELGGFEVKFDGTKGANNGN